MTRTILAASLLFAAHALAGEPDQHNDGPLSGGTSVGIIGSSFSQSAAQTFTVGANGRLDRVDLYIYAGSTLTQPLVLDIQTVGEGLPSGQSLASRELTPSPSGLQWVTFDVSAFDVSITQGQQLALVLHSNQDLSHGEYDAEGSQDYYAAGASSYHLLSGSWIPISNYDLLFHTYVSPAQSLCCDADFNHDGEFQDDDIEAFFRCLAGDCCITCGSADFNCDGDAATDADIESFFRVMAGGAC